MNTTAMFQFEVRDLWRGAILGSIAHAFSNTRFPEFAHEQWWSESNYLVHDTQGTSGALSFRGDEVAALFFDANSVRNWMGLARGEEAAIRRETASVIARLPPTLHSLADVAAQYLLQEIEGEVIAVATAGFGGATIVRPQEAWDSILANGGHIIQKQLLPFDEALSAWVEEFRMSEAESALTASLYEKKVARPDSKIRLSSDEAKLFDEIARGAPSMTECVESLREVGVEI